MKGLAVATCVLGVIALAAIAQAFEQCLQLLAYEFDDTEVPEPISAYVAHLDSVLPVDGEHEWDEAEFKKIEGEVEYPWQECSDYVQEVSTAVEEVLAERNDCAEVIEKTLQEPKHEDDQALKELRKGARADDILGPKMKARIACTQFQPYKEVVAVPPCLQKIVDRAKEVHLPETIEQFLLEVNEMREVVDHETIRRFGTPERKKKCAVYVKMVNKMRLVPGEDECSQESERETMSPNKMEKLSIKMFEDERYAMVLQADFACRALLTPGFNVNNYME